VKILHVLLCGLLLTPFIHGASNGTCVPNGSLGLSVPNTNSAACLMNMGNSAALTVSMEEGLIILLPGQPAQQHPGGQTGLHVLDQLSKLVFCPAAVAKDRAACLADPLTLRPGAQAFSGTVQLQAAMLTNKPSEPVCPATVHIEGSVQSPGKENFHLSASLVLFTAGSECKAVEQNVKLSYLPGTVSDSKSGNTQVSANLAPVQVAASVSTNSNQPVNPGNPEIQAQLDVLQAMILDIQARVTEIQDDQNEVIEENPTGRFDVDAKMCFEARMAASLTHKTEASKKVKVEGKTGADFYGSGFLGLTGGEVKRSGAADIKGEVTLPKLVVCWKGPVLKNLEGAVGAGSLQAAATSNSGLELFNELEQRLPALKGRIPELASFFQLNGARMESALNLVKALDQDADNPSALFDGKLIDRFKDLTEAMPLSPGMQARINNMMGTLENIGDQFRVCKQVNNLPNGLKATLQPICENLDGLELKQAIESIQDIVEGIRDFLDGEQ